MGVVERVVLDPQVRLVPPVIAEQETVTALAGTVEHELKLAGALTFTFHVAPVVVDVDFQLTTAAAEAATVGELSGLLAVNVRVAGETAAFVVVVTNGFSFNTAGAICPPGWAAIVPARIIKASNIPAIP